MPIKLIAIDLDNTLLNSSHQMSERNAETLTKAIEKGVKVVLATGKTRPSAQAVIDRLKLDTPGVYVQGLAVHYPDGRVRHNETLDADLVRQVITFAEDRGFEVALYSGERILARSSDGQARILHDEYGEPKPEGVGPLQNILNDTTINKLLLIRRGDQRKINAVRWQLGMQLDGKARLVQAIAGMLEVMPVNSSKGKGLKGLLKELDIAPEDVLAIGDGENDLEMIQMVGIGVAVGNATEKLKSAADYVVASNDEDGVAEAVERFVLQPLEEAEKAAATESTDSPTAESTAETSSDAQPEAESESAALSEGNKD